VGTHNKLYTCSMCTRLMFVDGSSAPYLARWYIYLPLLIMLAPDRDFHVLRIRYVEILDKVS
jgi:hypothetical protein